MAIAAKFPLVVSFGLGLSFASPVVAGSVADGTPAPAPQKGVNIASGAKAPATEEPVAHLQMSSDLLAFGRDNKDPLALIVAARIMKAVGGTDVDIKPEGRAAGDSAQKSGQAVTPDSILVEARDLAKGDKLTNLLIDEAGAMGFDGSAAQPKTHQDTWRGRPRPTPSSTAVGSSPKRGSPAMAAAISICSFTTRTTTSSAAAPAAATGNTANGGRDGPGRSASRSRIWARRQISIASPRTDDQPEPSAVAKISMISPVGRRKMVSLV